MIARKLDIQRSAELGVSPGYDSSTIVVEQQLDGALLDTFSQVIEAELQAWDLPDAKRVFFELRKMDVSVAGKRRAANGKGVRVLLHGAFSVGLMKFCRARQRANPGFLVLDSLFITYRARPMSATMPSQARRSRITRSGPSRRLAPTSN